MAETVAPFADSTEQEPLADLRRALVAVPHEFDKLKAQQETHLKATKGRFNIFTVLRNAHEEAGLHTRYLHHLLNPSPIAGHDCGTLFLELFLQTLKDIPPQRHDGQSTQLQQLAEFDLAADVKVERETRIPDGQIDILIKSPWGAIAIENKIYAGEQDEQISRYARYLRREYINQGKNGILLYLTREGDQSITCGEFKDAYHRISYRSHILPWIEKCLKETYPHVNINQALQQYRNVVEQLLGNPRMEKMYMSQVKELLRSYPGIIRHINDIANARDELRKECGEIFWKQVQDKLPPTIVIKPLAGSPENCLWWSVTGQAGDIISKLEPWIAYELKNNKEFYICVPRGNFKGKEESFEKEMRTLGHEVERKGGYNAARLLPNPFSDDALSKILADKDQMNVMASECAVVIADYVEALGKAWQKTFAE
ncbi:MAG: PD-(D/E)XK nuclease family protein [Phycisphaerales bacterium]|nr:PD-(D/E)XK nuclease family protein [Phycisphaerales bacterium]